MASAAAAPNYDHAETLAPLNAGKANPHFMFSPLPGAAHPSPPDPPTLTADSPCLVLMCGSHLNNAEKCEFFGLMLQSVAAQSLPVALWVSQSYTDDAYKAKAMEYFDRFIAGVKGPKPAHPSSVKHRLFMRKQRYRQFEHLAYLTAKYAAERGEPAAGDWVAFIDDDDQIGLRRMQTFAQLAAQHATLTPSPWNKQDQFPYVGIQSLSDKPLAVCTEIQGVLYLLNCFSKKPLGGEFVQYCVQFPVLRRFCTVAGPSVLRERLCDLLFGKYLGYFGYQGAIMAVDQDAHTEYVYWHGLEGQAHRTRDDRDDLRSVIRDELVRFIADQKHDNTPVDRSKFPKFFAVIKFGLPWTSQHDTIVDELLAGEDLRAIISLPSALENNELYKQRRSWASTSCSVS